VEARWVQGQQWWPLGEKDMKMEIALQKGFFFGTAWWLCKQVYLKSIQAIKGKNKPDFSDGTASIAISLPHAAEPS